MRGTGCEAAHQAYLEGKFAFSLSSREALEESRRCFERATRLDSGFARAWSALSYTCIQTQLMGWSRDAGLDLATAGRFARRGADLAPEDYFTRWHLAFYLLNSDQPERAAAECETALRLCGESQDLLVEMAEALICAGRLEDGIALIERARRTADWERRNETVLRCLSARNEANGYEDAVAALARLHRKPGDPRSLIDVQLLAAAFKGPGAAVPFYGAAAGLAMNGHGLNGHANGQRYNGHAANGHSLNGHGGNGHAGNGKAQPAAARNAFEPDWHVAALPAE
jgi:tetratricopeptide (TPR) repeat protein